jgi:hypothetical protein
MVSVTDPYCRIVEFLDWSRYFFFQVAPQLYSRGWVDPVGGTELEEYVLKQWNLQLWRYSDINHDFSTLLIRNQPHLMYIADRSEEKVSCFSFLFQTKAREHSGTKLNPPVAFVIFLRTLWVYAERLTKQTQRRDVKREVEGGLVAAYLDTASVSEVTNCESCLK